MQLLNYIVSYCIESGFTKYLGAQVQAIGFMKRQVCG